MYKIAWCPLCEQGWVVIVKDKQTSQLYAYCTEIQRTGKKKDVGRS